MSWNTLKIQDILTLKYGKSLPAIDRMKGSCKVYGSGGISGYHKEALVKGPGIIVGRKGSIGTIYYEENDFFPIDTVFYVELNSDEFDLKFVYYLLLQTNFKNLNTDAAVPGLNRDVAHSQIVKCPKLPTQEKIAGILSAYDDLIENNSKRIKILENMAQTIYKEWFVDFKFPGHENVQMIESELGVIPEKWFVGKIKDLNDILSGYAFKSNDLIAEGDAGVIKIKNIQSNSIDINNVEYITSKIAEKVAKFELKENDLLIAMTGAQVGKVGIIPKINKKYYLNQRVGKFCPNKNYIFNNQYVTQFTITDNFQTKIANTAQGAAQPNISASQIENIELLIPPSELIRKFEELIDSVFKQAQVLKAKNENLCKTRDLLLPRLISGEIDVENLEVAV